MARFHDLPVSHRPGPARGVLRRVGLLEDSEDEAQRVMQLLGASAMTVTHRTRGAQFLELLKRDSFDALVLDLRLPDMSGYEVLRRVRDELRSPVPILMLTAFDSEFEVVRTLEGGADDYLTKPFRSFELVARLNVLMRGVSARANDDAEEVIEGWVFNRATNTVTHAGQAVKLPRKQFEVARLLFQHLGRPVSREHLSQRVWNGEWQSRTVDTHVSRVRAQLNLTPVNGVQLHSIYGFGYRLDRTAPSP